MDRLNYPRREPKLIISVTPNRALLVARGHLPVVVAGAAMAVLVYFLTH